MGAQYVHGNENNDDDDYNEQVSAVGESFVSSGRRLADGQNTARKGKRPIVFGQVAPTFYLRLSELGQQKQLAANSGNHSNLFDCRCRWRWLASVNVCSLG